ncbi:MAG: alpha/beta hydrolase domain-containing protein [Chloroflexota bacterium]
MSVLGLDISSRTLLADGRRFGAAGAYERIDGVARFAADPTHPANAAIVDLDKAARDESGRVRFLADFCVLQPVDPAAGNRRLLFEVLNRGRKNLTRHFNRAAPSPVPTVEIDPGDGFLFERGWTLAWCGWQWDVIRNPILMGLEAPQALESGRPIVGWSQVELQLSAPSPHKLLADRVHTPYPAADVDDLEATLTVRDWQGGDRSRIPRERWRFAREEGGRVVPDPSHLWLTGGFEAGKFYEVIYRTDNCPVTGTGFLTVRDFSAFLRSAPAERGNPCAGRIDWLFAHGISQSGRFLRHFLSHGMNVDEAGRQVYDGVISQVAGARRGQFNHRYAQPSDQSVPSFGHLMPFADEPQTDELTGETGGLLDRQRELGGVPKIFHINTSAEYWRGDASLIHTDIDGTRDVEPPRESRIYHFAGTQHGPGTLPLEDYNPNDGTRGAHGFNAVDYTPLLRALLVAFDGWVTAGIEPPASQFPRLADGSAVPRERVLDLFRRIPGVTVPDPERILMVWRTDVGPRVAEGVGDPPARLGARYPGFVSAVDADGNERASIRPPDVSVPVATYTGWNPRHPETGGAGQINLMQGSTFPFPATRAERERTGDPRLSIEERYADGDDYLGRVRRAAEALVGERLLLQEDVTIVVDLAAERFDAFSTRGGRP